MDALARRGRSSPSTGPRSGPTCCATRRRRSTARASRSSTGWIRDADRRRQAAQRVRPRPDRRPRQHLRRTRRRTSTAPSATRYARAEAVAQVFLGVRMQCASATTTRSTAGRRTTTTASPPSSPGSTTACWRTTGKDKLDKHEFVGEQIVFHEPRRRGDAPAHAASVLKPRFLGARRRTSARRRPPEAPGRLGRDAGQPVLRPAPGQPHLVSPDGPRAGRSERRLPRHQPAGQRPLLDALAKDFAAHGFDLQAPRPHDHDVADVPALGRAERHERATTRRTSRTPLVRPLQAEQLLDAVAQVTRRAGEVRRLPGRHAGGQLPACRAPRAAGGRGGRRPSGSSARSASRPGSELRVRASDDTTLAQAFQLLAGPGRRGARRSRESTGQADRAGRGCRTPEIVEELYLGGGLARPATTEARRRSWRRLDGAKDRRFAWEMCCGRC